MKINFNNSILAEIQTTDSELKILRAVDGWGNPIDVSKILIDDKNQDDIITISKKEYDRTSIPDIKAEDMITISKKEYNRLKKDSYTLYNCVDQ